jgi:hypothetical protein
MRHGCPRTRPRPRRPPRSRSCAFLSSRRSLNDLVHGSKVFRRGLSGWCRAIGCEATRPDGERIAHVSDGLGECRHRLSSIWPTIFKLIQTCGRPPGIPVCFADALVDTSSSTRILIRCAPSASGDGCSSCPVRPDGLRRRPHQRGRGSVGPHAKSVPVFAAARRAFGLADSMRELTPPQLIRAILCAPSICCGTARTSRGRRNPSRCRRQGQRRGARRRRRCASG